MRTPTLFAGLAFSIAVMAGTPPTPAMLENLSSTPAGFEENKGQVRTTDGAAAPNVRYRLSQGNTQLFLLENGIAYQFSRTHLPAGYADLMAAAHGDANKLKELDALREQFRLETFRMDMMLEGADPNASITTEGRSEDYTQYYNRDALDVHSYTRVTYHEIYPGIDWVVYTTAKGMKYDFVVRPGADPDQIRMRFKHHEELTLDEDGNLIHGNRMGRFTEERPVSFQDGKEVPTSFVLEGNTLRFALENYDRNQTLIIDPARMWATYYGGSTVDGADGCTVDASGNVYLSGRTASTNGIAAGGYQSTFGGARDAFLVKFNSSGVRLWATYYGGEADDEGWYCAVDGSGNVYLAGLTASTSGIASGGQQNTYGGGTYDAFLAKFNASGTRLWATYYGGANEDHGTDCIVDASGNVYLTGNTASTDAVASSGHQNTHGGGYWDAFLVKFTASGTRLWGTYYGGEADENGWVCAIDGSNNVYLGGHTGSASGVASAGHQNTFGGDSDAFLAKFNSNGVRQWGSYYGGTGYDLSWGCAFDSDQNVYWAGETGSSTGIASGGHQNTYGGAQDGFLVKLNSSGARQWGTYYGGPDFDRATRCVVDVMNNVYLIGWTESSTGIASGGHQNTFGGIRDAFLVKFNAGGTRGWATYYGGEGDDQGIDGAPDASGNMYLAGWAGSNTGIADGGHQNTFGGGELDGFLAKFERTLSITTGIINGPICTGQAVSVPFSVSGAFNAGNTFTAYLSDASGSFAGQVGIGSLSGTASGSIPASIPLGTTPGNGYRIRVVASNPIVTGTDNGTNLVINDRTTNCTCADVVETEANNSAATANAIAYDTPVSGITGPCSLPDNTVDHFSFTTTTQGVLHVEACLSNTGPSSLNVTFRVLNTAGTTLGTFILPAGANNVPVPGSFEFPCRGIGSYRIAVDNPSTAHCTNYAFSYTILPPVFANDPEPNDGLGTSATQLAYNTDQDGRTNFDGETTYDYYRILLPTNGVLNIEVQAEHEGATPNTMTVALLSVGGTVLQTWPVTVGANGIPVTSNVSITCRSTVNNYHIRMNSAVCGTSYRFKYTVTPPLFAGDTEPNNGTPGTTAAHDTYMDGNLQFDGESTYDYYNIVPPINGVMTLEVQAEHVGGSTGTMDMVLYTTAGIVIQSWSVPVGANSTAVTTTVSIPCRSFTTDYDLRFATTTCGVSYRWKYTMTAPLFANDLEPNNGGGGSTEAHDTWYEGQIGFDNQTDDDVYNVVPPFNGVMNIQVEAEHTGAIPGTFNVVLLTTAGSAIQSWTMVAGANGIPVSTTVSVPCRSFTTDYDLRFEDVTCGVSYRWKYTMTTPLFANDAEPNNSGGGSTEADSTWYEGQIGFDNQTDDDIYNLVPATNGVMNIEVHAEHTGASPGTVNVTLLTTAGVTIQSWSMAVGASGVPQTTMVSVPCRSHITDYDLRFSDVTCGVSYRWKYTMTPPLFAEDVEPNNTTPGTALAHDTYTEGHLAFDTESAYDYYRIVPGFNGKVNVELQAEHTGTVPGTITVLLLNTAGTTLQTWSFPVGANSAPITTTLSRTCLNGGTGYDLRLASSVCGASYKLKYTLTPAVFSNDTEPNNSTSQAIILPETQTAQGQLNFPSGDNNDTYRVNLTGDGILNVAIDAEHAGIETNAIMTVELYISTGTVLQTWTAPIGAGATAIGTLLSKTCRGNTGNYYLQLSSSICGTSYRISYSVTPPVFTQDVEPNNSTGQAIVLTPGQPNQGHLNFYFGDNTDHYRANIPTDGVLNVNIEAEHTGTDPNALVTINLYISTGTVLQTWTAPVGAGSVAISTALSKTCLGLTVPYYLSLSSSICGTSYRISYTVAPPVFANDNEANDGGGLAHDTYAEGHLEFYNLGPYDYYNIVPPVNGVMTFEVQAEHVGAVADSMQLRLINTTGTTLQFWNIPVGANGVPVTSTFSIPCRGNTTDYDVRLSSYACGTSYKWKYTMTAPFFAPDVEPNNQTPGGVGSPVAHDTYQTGHVEFHSQTDHDLYNIVAPTNGTMIFTVDAEHAGAVADSMELRLYTSAGTTIQFWTIPVGANGVPVTSTFSITCRTSTTDYDVRIISHVCGTSYRWKYTMATPVFANDVEPNGTTGQAIVLPEATPMTGQINFGGGENNDYYRINLPTDGVLNVTIEAEHSGASTIETIAARISLSTSTTLATWNAAVGANATPSSTSFSLSCRGATVTYYLNLSSNVCGASYRVSWTVTPPVYTNDPEPNNSGAGTPMNLNVAGQQGHIGFYNTTDNDYYGFTHPGGPWSVTISAEHVNAGEGSMVLEVRNSASTLFASFTVPVGGSSTSLTNTFTLPSLSAGSFYRMILKDVTCGVSYRIHCYDADGDGTCNAADVCAGGPEPGMPCNDNNSGTINDTVQPNCQCEGTLLGADCNGVPGGPALPGTSCNDNNTCTVNDVLDANCLCAGTFADADADGTCDANDLCPGGPEPGTACNDNNGATINDIIQSNCQCVGTLLGSDCNGVPGGPAGPGTACNDNNLCTVNDVFDANCLCAGTFADADADGTCDANDLCPGGPEPGTACNDNNVCTIGDVIGTNCLCAGTFADADADGTCDANDLCAGGPEPGTACNDNNACTTGDVIGTNCLCAGTFADADSDGTCDANDLCAGGPEPGTACNDNNGATINDIIQVNCQCAGTLLDIDCNGVPGGPAVPGTPCNDNNVCTVNDTFDANCLCAGTFADADADGTCDASDVCPGGPEPGTLCNDNNVNTTNDVVGSNCACSGTPVTSCTQNLSIEFQTDANPGHITWQIRQQGSGTVVQSGGPLATPNATFPVSTCVPNGSYYLRVMDSGGDGIVNGGYILRTSPGGVRLVDNFRNFNSGGVSQIPTSEGFTIPLGSTTGAIYTSCDKLDWTAGEYLVCSSVPDIAALYGGPNAATSGYEFWFFNPNGGYSFRKFRAHNVSDSFGPANAQRACHIKLNNWATANFIPTGVLMNVRVRTRNAGVNGNWGPACRMKIDPVRAQCPLTKLMDIPGNEFLSCGATRPWGAGNYVHAVPVAGANKYQFRFRIAGEPLFVVTRTTTAYFLQLNWTPALTPTQYYVDVRVSKDNGATWCTAFVAPALTTQWGDFCNLTISAPPVNGGNQNMSTEEQDPVLRMYPNPNRGDQLYLQLDAVEDGVNTVSVDIYDLFGKRVSARTIAVNDGFINTVLDLDGNMASGMYMVNITAGEKTYTERLVIQK